jgi:hypothetical protein
MAIGKKMFDKLKHASLFYQGLIYRTKIYTIVAWKLILKG